METNWGEEVTPFHQRTYTKLIAELIQCFLGIMVQLM